MQSQFYFQNLILNLEIFWKDKGCILWLPFSEKVGAGTMNPATVLRVLGPEPLRIGYVEPSYRPDDGRFGHNPNRVQMHHQYQVILKPDPGNPQELYLESLEAIGVKREEHDIRFVEDNWESPALGAWGLGWEVWLDGMEITQFTYFQQAGGLPLNPVSVELTYGLERIAFFLQGVNNIFDIRWNEEFTMRELLHQQEVDYCEYAFNIANVERLRKMFDLFYAEAELAMQNALVLPAHDYILRCSHTFNLLDTRGVIGVTERANLFAKMRDLFRKISKCYLNQREEKGFPFKSLIEEDAGAKKPVETELPDTKGEHDFVLEIGCEELPSADLSGALSFIEREFKTFLQKQTLTFKSLHVYGTPRRLTVYIKKLSGMQKDREIEVKGPPAKVAFDSSKNLTKAGLGFVKKQGIEAGDLFTIKDAKGQEYVHARKLVKGKSAGELLLNFLPKHIKSISFPKSMRWNFSGVSFSRPIRWLLALLDESIIPFKYAGLRADRISRANRYLGSKPISIACAEAYFQALEENQIEISPQARRESITDALKAIEKMIQGRLELDEALLTEVTNLVEFPSVFVGTFDKGFLELPREVLIAVMKKHQRYFPFFKNDSEELMPFYAGVANGEEAATELVKQGNNSVIQARYCDAQFFYQEDCKKKLGQHLEKIKTLTFETRLGSMFEKSRRMEQTIVLLARACGYSDLQEERLKRAAFLCKADLGSNLVTEMTSLQGIMGDYYAQKNGEEPEVCRAIREHYWPTGASGSVPDTPYSFILAMSDKFDSLLGLFACSLKPTGSTDPFGFRRDAIGILRILIENEISLSIIPFLNSIQNSYPIEVKQEHIERATEFLKGRLFVLFKEKGFRSDAINSVLALAEFNPYKCLINLKIIKEMTEKEDWPDVFEQYSRCHRMVRRSDIDAEPDVNLIKAEATARLFEMVKNFNVQNDGSLQPETIPGILRELRPVIEEFFNNILVDCEDLELKKTHYAILQKIVKLVKRLGDFSQLEGF
ncbi:glycine--tRNA ligase subunit beta [Candidatus Riflebacteria bacterium]